MHCYQCTQPITARRCLGYGITHKKGGARSALHHTALAPTSSFCALRQSMGALNSTHTAIMISRARGWGVW